jgi:3-hydroxybutyryl-CoA dehydrogenase
VYVIEDTPGLVVTRTVAMLANLAFDALASRVASEPDIDTAMRLGVNYPLGPLAWGRQWGVGTLLRILDRLEDWYRDGRYRASPLLRQAALVERLHGPRTYAEKLSAPPAGSAAASAGPATEDQ